MAWQQLSAIPPHLCSIESLKPVSILQDQQRAQADIEGAGNLMVAALCRPAAILGVLLPAPPSGAQLASGHDEARLALGHDGARLASGHDEALGKLDDLLGLHLQGLPEVHPGPLGHEDVVLNIVPQQDN